ncbi:hypothetical protein PHLCEN_2v7821 [Hermanssonia centrifuga]|uniref:Uncharacterized protein n=1 Tax=Hermanssonia centrifuga TaxID=98765 RepID=A0A2R6NVM4_9APHY|nr:hypothetical protein PHLCEN_2v7821 [Hermanssonia centrifuga]
MSDQEQGVENPKTDRNLLIICRWYLIPCSKQVAFEYDGRDVLRRTIPQSFGTWEPYPRSNIASL